MINLELNKSYKLDNGMTLIPTCEKQFTYDILVDYYLANVGCVLNRLTGEVFYGQFPIGRYLEPKESTINYSCECGGFKTYKTLAKEFHSH